MSSKRNCVSSAINIFENHEVDLLCDTSVQDEFSVARLDNENIIFYPAAELFQMEPNAQEIKETPKIEDVITDVEDVNDLYKICCFDKFCGVECKSKKYIFFMLWISFLLNIYLYLKK